MLTKGTTMTQVELIRDYLLTGQSLTPLEALEKFGALL
jgi:hypothetical protein